jgi:hypothetical protein
MSSLAGLVFIANPKLSTIKEIQSFVLGYPPSTASPFRNADTNIIIVHRQGGIVEIIDVSNIQASYFLTKADYDTIQESIINRMKIYQQTEGFDEYNIKIGNPGSIMNLNINPSIPLCCCLTNKLCGYYFDLVMFILDQKHDIKGVLTYSKRQILGCVHSGDVGQLYHGITIPNYNPEFNYVVGVVGYNKIPLFNYINQVPAVCIISSDTSTVVVVPLNLAEAVCGNGTLAMLGVITFTDSPKFIALSRQLTVNNVNTGEINANVSHAAKESMRNAHDIIDSLSTSSIPEVVSIKQTTENKFSILPTNKPIIYFEDGLLIPDACLFGLFEKSTLVNFSTQLSIYTNTNSYKSSKNKKPITILPLLSIVTGPPSAITMIPTINDEYCTVDDYNFIDIHNTAPFVIFNLSDKWNVVAAMGCTMRCTGLFIIHPSIKGTVQEIMQNMNRDALCMSSHNSVVIVFIDGNYYWYRGVLWKGLVDYHPNFGDDVSTLFTSEKINKWIESGGILSILKMPVLIPKSFDQVMFLEELHTIPKAFDQVNSYSIDDLCNPFILDNVYDLLTQISCILPPEELSKITVSVAKILKQKIESSFKDEITDISTNIFEGKLSPKKLKELTIRKGIIVGLKRKYQQKIGFIIDNINGLSSQHASSSRKTDLNRIIRRATIGVNVSEFNKMTHDDFLALIVKVDEFAIFSINPNAFDAVRTIDKSLMTFINSNTEFPLSLLDRCPQLDGDTVATLIEYNDHPLGGHKCLTLPKSYTGEGRNMSALPIPNIHSLINIDHPDKIDWLNLCNTEPAMWRLIFRHLFRTGNETRELQISPTSGDLTLFLGWLFLSAALSMVHDISSPTESSLIINFDDTRTKYIRNLIGLVITTLSAGQIPKTDIFTFFGHNVKLLKANESWIISGLAKILKYTGWDQTMINLKIGTYLIKLLRNILTDPLTDKLRKSIKDISLKKHTNHIENRNKELQFAHIAVTVLFNLKDDQSLRPNIKEISKRILEFKPTHAKVPDSIKSLIRFFGENDSGCVTIDDDYWENKNGHFHNILAIACDIHTKRSGEFAKPKKQILDQLITDSVQGIEDMIDQLKVPFENYTTPGKGVHIQNYSALQNKDKSKLKGDAEFTRISYSVSKEEDIEFEKKLQYVLCIETDIKVPEIIEETTELSVDFVHPIIKIFENQSELDFVVSFFSLNKDSLNISKMIEIIYTVKSISSIYKELIIVLIKESNINAIKFYDIIEMLLMNWQDNVNGEVLAIKLLST